jgi:NAD dependent epimerase/dehydratase family enzyme
MQLFIWQVKTLQTVVGAKQRKTVSCTAESEEQNFLVEYFANSNHKPQVIISASAVGFYGDRGAEIVDEDSKAGNGFLANVCVQWEDALKVAVEAGIRVKKCVLVLS